MRPRQITEKHHIVIGSTRYQIVFDAKAHNHDILIRGLFKWESDSSARFTHIDFLFDNLSTVTIPFLITKAVWCRDQKRIELHINEKKEAQLRTLLSLSIPEGFDLEKENKIELVLRNHTGATPLKECERFILPPPNESFETSDPTGKNVEDDKDGSILIGTRILKP